jgi:ElaB/YqjD/DUF883 family membrane-anchored ribosome-binding protein
MTTQEANDKLTADLQAVMRDAEELMRLTAGVPGEQANDLRARLQRALDSAKINYSRWQDKAVDAAKNTDNTIRNHPYESMGISLGLGILLGVLVGRRL